MRRFVITLSPIWVAVLLLVANGLAAPSVGDISNQTITVGSAIGPLPFTLNNFTPKQTIRTMAANITSGSSQAYEDPGTRILEGLHPDVVMLQEFNVGTSSSTSEVRAWVDTTFGTGFNYFRESSGGIPNGVISRWPIVASGSWEDSEVGDRGFAWARIDIPGDKNLWVVSVHLKASSGSANSTKRQTQALQLVAYIKANVPTGDYLLLGGDFNTYSISESCLSTLGSLLTTAAPYPVDQVGDSDTNASRGEHYDWVLAEPELDALEIPVQIGSLSFANGLVFDSRVFSPLSSVSPVLSTDSGVTGMQHMAVVRAFAVPAAEMLTVTGGDGTSTASDTFVVTVNPLLTLFPDWIAGYRFSEPNALASADPDGDGWSNAQEYAFGLVPNVAGGTLVKIENGGTGSKITYLQRSGVTYTVKSATDLAAGFTGTVNPMRSNPQPAELPSGYEQYEATLTAPDRGFLKVEAVVP